MKIVIDLTYTPSGGSLTQILNMIEEFNFIDDIDLTIYSKESNCKLLNNVVINDQVVFSRMANFSVFTRLIWGQLILPFKLKSVGADILFCPGNISPIFSPVMTVVWIGTIGPFFKDFYKNFKISDQFKLYINKIFMIGSSLKSDAVIFESSFTKNLFIKKYGVKNDKSYVINVGFDKYFLNNTSLKNNKIFSDFIDDNYFLCVSHLYPYKNIIRLLVAFKQVNDESGGSLKLVIAGSRDYYHYNKKIEICILNLGIENNVILLGRVEKVDLNSLYRNAIALVFPSPFENFAYTLVEAMSCGTPIVCANTTAMPETCGEAALYFDPYKVEEISEKLSLVETDIELRQKLSAKSLSRSFELPNYKEVTLETLNIMKNLVDG